MTAAFAALFIALYVAHGVGDHWVQTHHQACAKGGPGWAARLACGRHVLTMTVTKMVALAVVVSVLDVPVTALGLVIGLGLDAVTHYWADRRTGLARLAAALGKGEYLDLGTAAHPDHPVTATGKPALTLGTGAYHLDQTWHLLWLGVAALLIASI
ncbi:transcriptional regulator [Streptomyces sp. NBC_01185]|uniref:transcriptional regulator n=1 Tax=Streptomyces sp. NBC_01185 TaxID=2903764 RepID=UPI003867471E|nr:transcriptional regulator [Streptomyces sp. NBC_01185]